jgi:hypothetical protein
MSHPFVSNYEWCSKCRNWFRLLWRRHWDVAQGYPERQTEMLSKCGHNLLRTYNPDMDGDFSPGALQYIPEDPRASK